MKALLISLLALTSCISIYTPDSSKISSHPTILTRDMYVHTVEPDTSYCEYKKIMWGVWGDTVCYRDEVTSMCFIRDLKYVRQHPEFKKWSNENDKAMAYRDTRFQDLWFVRFVLAKDGFAVLIGSIEYRMPSYFFSTSNICE